MNQENANIRAHGPNLKTAVAGSLFEPGQLNQRGATIEATTDNPDGTAVAVAGSAMSADTLKLFLDK